MKKYINLLFISILFIGCSKNVTNLNTVVKDRKTRTLVNEYVDNVIVKNDNRNIYITGNIGKNPNVIEIGLYNQRPILYTDQDTDYLNSYIKSKQFGFFRYRGINFYVTNDLKNIFNLKYKSFEQVKNKFEKQNMPEPTDYYSMYININKKDSSIVYYSNLSKESLKWKEIK